jgi:hypothetical protein
LQVISHKFDGTEFGIQQDMEGLISLVHVFLCPGKFYIHFPSATDRFSNKTAKT